jgi:hypothetical protein
MPIEVGCFSVRKSTGFYEVSGDQPDGTSFFAGGVERKSLISSIDCKSVPSQSVLFQYGK